MNSDGWIRRIYDEEDSGRNIAIGLAGAAGLAAYLVQGDSVIAAFVALIVFPVVKVAASSMHSQWKQSRERNADRDQMKRLFDSLGREERAVVQAFVSHGGSVVRWGEVNRSQRFPAAGIESLISRGLIHLSVTADGFKETFVLDTELFDYAQKVLDEDVPHIDDDIPF